MQVTKLVDFGLDDGLSDVSSGCIHGEQDGGLVSEIARSRDIVASGSERALGAVSDEHVHNKEQTWGVRMSETSICIAGVREAGP